MTGLFNKDTGFYNTDKYIDESYLDWSSTDPRQILEYPIAYLNDALGGITKSELVVIGADSGVGKTEMANSLAFHNASAGKNVYLFSLEGDKYDVVNRQRYKMYCDMVQESKCYEKGITYRDFIQNRISNHLRASVRSDMLVIDDMLKVKYKTLKIYNREKSLSMDAFEAHLELINGSADLVIIDHLHYFDFKSRDEYGEINEIMKRIKRLQDNCRVPIVLISHLRKKDKSRVFPDQNDFHGSSNIVKQADTCIAVAHVELQDEKDNDAYGEQIKANIYQTGIRVVKARTGFSQRIVGVLDFDLQNRKYSREYNLMICGNNFITPMESENYPKWSKNARTQYNDKKTA